MSRYDYRQEEKLFLAALSSIRGLGPRRLRSLYQQTDSWQKAWEAPTFTWQNAKIPPAIQTAWQESRLSLNIEKLNADFRQNHIELISENDFNYPTGFNNLKDKPLLLYAQGIWPANGQIKITVVGSRNPSRYGEEAADRLVPDLAKAGFSIVSGLAAGLDARAHRLTLGRQGHTVAILGSGLKNIYPAENIRLAKDIVSQNGLLLSEYPPRTNPLPGNFLRRNQLLAAISDITLILEAGPQSGSMHTAKQAKMLNKKIYAVPGNIFSRHAAGCHRLIKNGAFLIDSAADISGETKNPISAKEAEDNLNTGEKSIIALLKEEFNSFSGLNSDEIQKRLKLDTSSVNSTLSILEIKNLIRQSNGRYYFLPSNTQNQL